MKIRNWLQQAFQSKDQKQESKSHKASDSAQNFEKINRTQK
jgi:hypothetical protein